MSKLYKLKEWFTVSDAAKRLSAVFEEEVSEADVLHLVLSSKLQLSIYFPNETYAQPWVEILFGEHWLRIEHDTLVSGEVNPSFEGEAIEETRSNYKDEPFTARYRRTRKDTVAHKAVGDVVKVKGIWNLPMIHDEYQIISERYGRLIGSLPINTTSSHLEKNYEGMVCISDDKGEIFEVKINYEYYRDNPCSLEEFIKDDTDHVSVGEFPKDSFFVVRTDVLREFEQEFVIDSDDKSNSGMKKNIKKPESTRKTDNLLRALTAIAMDDYGYKLDSAKSNAPQDIVNAMSNHGVNFDARTVRNWLKEGVELLPPNLIKINSNGNYRF